MATTNNKQNDTESEDLDEVPACFGHVSPTRAALSTQNKCEATSVLGVRLKPCYMKIISHGS